tara:strand:- start:12748 stop:13326 length:579 start_codon:yes stop_codon:yes gene_type:complete
MTEYFAHETAEVSSEAKIGKGTRIWHHAQIREGVIIGENCHISKGVYIDKNVKIGNNVKIQNGVNVYTGVTLEDDVFLGPASAFTNDLYPRSQSKDWEVVHTLLKKGTSVGANATILCGIFLGEYCMIAAGAVVLNNTLPHSLMVGNPARLKNFVCGCGNELILRHNHSYNYNYFCAKCKKHIVISFQTEHT